MKKKKREAEVSPLSASVTSVMRSMAEQHKNVHPEIWARWFDIVGSQMYKRAFPKHLKGKTLTIGVGNSVWLQELSFIRQTIIDRLAEEVGPDVVKEIRFVLDPGLGKGKIDNSDKLA